MLSIARCLSPTNSCRGAVLKHQWYERTKCAPLALLAGSREVDRKMRYLVECFALP